MLLAQGLPVDDLKLDTMLEVDHDGELELKGELHPGRVPEHVSTVEVDDDELQLLHGELLADARPGADAERDERVGVPSLALLVLRVEPLRSEHVRVRKLLGVFS